MAEIASHLQVGATDIEFMMVEFRRQNPDRFIGKGMFKLELNLKNGSLYFYGSNRDIATMRRNDFVLYCKEKGIDALSCTMIPEEKAAPQTKPVFSSLSREQVNDLIAMKVMGLKPHHEFPDTLWVGPPNGEKRRWNPTNRQGFDPYTDLNDCWIAEDKLMTSIAGRDSLRLQIFGLYFVGEGSDGKHSRKMDCLYPDQERFHLTAKQRCHCILKAIGEVE